MTIQPLTKLNGSLSGLSKNSCLWQTAEWYLSSGKNYKVKAINSYHLTLESHNKKENILIKIIRKISYLTIILPLIAAVICRYHRRKYTFDAPMKLAEFPWQNNLRAITDKLLKDLNSFDDEINKSSAIEVQNKPETADYLAELLSTYENFYQLKILHPIFDQNLAPSDNSFEDFTGMFGLILSSIYPDLDVQPPFLDPSKPSHQDLIEEWKMIVTSGNEDEISMQ